MRGLSACASSADTASAAALPSTSRQGITSVCGFRSRPFDIGHRDPARHARGDRRDHLRMQERVDIAVALQLPLLDIHRPGDVDSENELEIDGNVLG